MDTSVLQGNVGKLWGDELQAVLLKQVGGMGSFVLFRGSQWLSLKAGDPTADNIAMIFQVSEFILHLH